ncbi:MAG: diaminobutyrate--2-oxoglutarate transaminase [Pseudomonadales bacterium]|jgi:diaminobutyrate-2-oxoglutarate transaminase|nr:diaminobutyrate--2-oxoglutarate transaminase [Pseudomonadales bacterium]
MTVFNELESEVRSYCRAFPVTFTQAKGCHLEDDEGREYLDFLAGAGTLNYGHNHDVPKQALVDYIVADGITHGLDMQTEAKARFLETFRDLVLKPRQLDYKVQFPGPTGANAVEAALKLARKIKGRPNVVSFSNGFHGCTLGALAATGNGGKRAGAGQPLQNVTFVPYDGCCGPDVDTVAILEGMLSNPSSGMDHPAAVIVECIQGEGGINAASLDWLQRLEACCRRHDMLLIVDDIQAGCGRTGTFFSFEPAGIKPDIVTLSKSISGYGLPFALTLMKPELDVWSPGEHNGTFRGNNHAFVTATATLQHFWASDDFARSVREKAALLEDGLERIVRKYRGGLRRRGRGLMQGIVCDNGEIAGAICAESFRRGLIIETSGPDDEVVKCLMPLVITEQELRRGLDIMDAAFGVVLGRNLRAAS